MVNNCFYLESIYCLLGEHSFSKSVIDQGLKIPRKTYLLNSHLNTAKKTFNLVMPINRHC